MPRRLLRNSAPNLAQSMAGKAAWWALKLPVAPPNLAVHIHLDFFAEASGRGWLSVSACEHGHVGPFGGESGEAVAEFDHGRTVYLGNGIGDAHRHGGVVDIL